MDAIKALLTEDRPAEALRELHSRTRQTTDYAIYAKLCRLRNKIRISLPDESRAKDLKLAILSGSTTGFLEQPLVLELETLGISARLHCSDYNTYVSEMLDPGSDTVAFAPDAALFLMTPFNIPDWPDVGDSPERVDGLARGVCEHWLGLCARLHEHCQCEIIISNLHMLATRQAGNLGSRLAWEHNSYLRKINAGLSDRALEYVHILDVDMLASVHGITHWFDIRYWHHSKQPVAFECLVPYVRNVAAIIGGLYGRTAKCVVVDLDNTLWGGVVGDDGVEGIKIGEGDAVSEAYKSFQEYLLGLKKRGVLLAVCSKNDEVNALAPFDTLPDMVLKRDDFVAFRANWEPKPENLERIARELNIGLDALVFVDDNPAEREHVRQALPQVKVLELSDDPSEYVLALDQCGWLEPVRLTDEDRLKTEQYRNNARRSELESSHTDYGDYLASLLQEATIQPFQARDLDRITQLINKTNQFNLTTQRLSRSEVEAMMTAQDRFNVSVRLKDRFGDNGLISVLSGELRDGVLRLDLWLMSCRVFKRGVEHLLANYLFEKAAELGVNTVIGTYRPTEKNRLVENFYAELGFSQQQVAEESESIWAMPVGHYRPIPVHITLTEQTGNE